MNTKTKGFEMPSQFEQQMEELKLDMREMRAAVTEMAKAMSKLAVLEERNLATNQAIEKVVNKLEKVDQKVVDVELEQVKFVATVMGISKTMKFMWGAFGGGVLYVGGQVIQSVLPHIAK